MICPECGEHVMPASAAMFAPPAARRCARTNSEPARKASNAAIMAHQVAPKIHTYPVSRVEYARHPGRDGKPDSMRVDYYSGLRRVARRVGLLRAWRVCGRKGAAVVGA